MNGLFEYVQNYKNILFSKIGLTEIDNVIFSRLAYLDLSGFEGKTIKYISQVYQLKNTDNKNNVLTAELLKSLGNTDRFGNIVLIDYSEIASTDLATAFCGLTFKLYGNIFFIAFRGTDDKIMSIYEDAELAYSFPISSQLAALSYVNHIIEKYRGYFYLGGHSKGGNLALFAYVFLSDELKKCIIKVYNNDGPGFPKELVKILITPQISEKIITIAPEDSIVGRMLESGGKYTIIKSNASRASQHNVFTWIINGGKFETSERFSLLSEYIENMLTESLGKISQDDMRKAAETIYTIAVRSGIKTTKDINKKNYRSIILALIQMLKSENDVTSEISSIIKTLINSFLKSIDIEKFITYNVPDGLTDFRDKNEIKQQIIDLIRRDNK